MSNTSDATLALADVADLAHTIAEANSPDRIFAAVADAAHRYIGYKLFTIMAFHAKTMQVRRLYSSNPDAYPLGGGKGKRDTQWGRHVLEQGRPFIGRTADDIRVNFNDHEVIFGLGLESVLNVPVRLYARTIGTMNLLHNAEFYDTSDLGWGSFLAAQLVAPLCTEHRRSAEIPKI